MRRVKGKASNVTSALPAATSNMILQEKQVKSKNHIGNENKNEWQYENKNKKIRIEERRGWKFEIFDVL
jgi:hypothetical protein